MKKQNKLVAFLMSLTIMFLVLGTGNSLDGRSVQAEEMVATDTDAGVDGEVTTENVTTGEALEETTEASTEEITEEVVAQDVNFDNGVYVGDNYQVTFTLDSYWESGYNATITIANTGDNVIENWTMAFPLGQNISNIWNATIAEVHEDYFVIKNDGWNQDIAVGGSVSFGITCYEAFTEYPAYYTLLGNEVELADGDYSVAYEITEDWGFGYKAQLTITNNKDTALEDWRIKFNYGDNLITQIWDGMIISDKDGEYFIGCQPYNQNIAPGASVTFGFLVEPGTSDAEVRDIVVTEYVVGDGSEDGEEIFETDNFLFVYTLMNPETKELGLYMLSTVDCTMYEIYTSVDDSEYVIADSVSEDSYMYTLSNDFAKTNIYVRGYFEQNSYVDSEIITIEYSNEDYLVIINDADGDGLDDTYEVIYTGTNPFLIDSDENGISDSDEDLDGDGLSNLKECEIGTLPCDMDSDNDDVSDSDEIYVYFTNPVDEDTDDEGLLDGEDIALGFDPNLQDTDGNGIFDCDEKSLQTYEYDIVDDEKKEILSVSIELECEGLLENNVYVQNMNNLDVMSSQVVGLVGVPVEIQVDSEFDTAKITFTYDDDMLGDTPELNLCMMWYDEENNQYVLLEDSVVDIESNTVTYETNHFSMYMVVDKQVWFDTCRQDVNYRESGNIVYYDIMFVVDTSESMEGESIELAKTSLNTFIDSLESGDYAGMVSFSETATLESGLTSDKSALKDKVDLLDVLGGTIAMKGLWLAAKELVENSTSNEDMLILICDGDVVLEQAFITYVIENDIRIHCINVATGTARAMENLAYLTGGGYYFATTTEDIVARMEELQNDTIDSIDMTDTDGDGIYDVYEIYGTKAPNGLMVYTDATLKDSDGDGISDFDELGGLPEEKQLYLGGDLYTCTFNHMKSDPGKIDTDGDGIPDVVDDHDNLKDMVCITKLQHDNFLIIDKIMDNGQYAYGGAQGWWAGENQTVKEYGCGAIAMCNVELYLMLYNEDFYDEDTYTKLTGDRLGYRYYMDYVNERIEEVYKVDYLTVDGTRPDDMEVGMLNFCNSSKKADVNNVSIDWAKTNKEKTASENISNMIKHNIPVVASYYDFLGSIVDEIGDGLACYVELDCDTIYSRDIYSHYFTITGEYYFYHKQNGRYEKYYRISTWGKMMYIQCDEWLEELDYTTNYIQIEYTNM